MQVLIGIDDTDNLDSVGTGRLSRWLAEALARDGFIRAPTNTRHQFLVDDAIPYTSHNSSACIAAEALLPVAKIADAAIQFLQQHEHEGANPGLCVLARGQVNDAMLDLGRRAQREVIDLEQGHALARAVNGSRGRVWWGGETGQGVIGAIGGTALRSTGEDGRFIGLPGIRALSGQVPVHEIIARSAIEAVTDEAGTPLASDAPVDTRDWVRPVLRGDRPVLVLTRDGEVWAPAEKLEKGDNER